VSVTKRIRFEVMRRDGHRCHYCGATATDARLTIDHVLPTALGGSDDASNLVTACADCNAGKTSTPPDGATVAKVAHDAERWAQAMQAAAERTRQRRAEADAYIDALHDSLRFFADYELPDDWRASLAGFHAAGLPVDLMRRALDTAIDNRRIDWKGRWKYACGTAWRMLSAIQQEARNLIENGDESHENPGGQDAPREHGEGGA